MDREDTNRNLGSLRSLDKITIMTDQLILTDREIYRYGPAICWKGYQLACI